jgi:outer membrane protein TolC
MKQIASVLTLALAALLVPAAAAVAGAQPAPVRLTLDEAIARGLDASHRLAELAARDDAAKAAEDSARASARPQLALLGGYARTNHVDEFGIQVPGGPLRVIYPDVPDNYRSRIDLQWPIYTAGRVAASTRAATAEARASEQDRAGARADLKLEITRAYWAVITARASANVLQGALDRIGAHLNDVRNQLAVGLVPPNDVLSVQAQQSHEQMLLIDAQNMVESTAADFRRLVGTAPDAPFDLADSLETPLAPLPAQVAALVDEGRARRSERQALRLRITAAGERTAAARAAERPTVSVAGGYDVARPNPRIFPRAAEWNPSWDAGVNVSWSLWDGGRTRAEIAQAGANHRAAEERLLEFDSVLDVDVRQRALDVASAAATIAAAADGVTSAAEARRVVTERFSAGVATNTDVLDAQVALLSAELDRTRALAAARLAAARLERAVGR